MIEYRDVYKAFDVPVLAGVDLTVRTGETLGIVGPSGTGKSVLLKTTIGLIVPDRGDVLIDGESVLRASSRETLRPIRRKVGYVFQNAALFDSMNVYENVCQGLPRRRARRAWAGRRSLRRVCESLEDVNLDPAQVLRQAARRAVGRHAQARGPGPRHRGPARDPALRRAGDRPRPRERRRRGPAHRPRSRSRPA